MTLASPSALSALADELHAARREGTRVPTERAELDSIDAVYALQRELDARETSPLIGFKLGATLEPAIATLGLDEPFHASLFAEHHATGDAEIALFDTARVTLETEFVVLIGEDIVAGEEPTSAASVRAATAAVLPGFELVATRFDMSLPGNGRHLIADSGGNHATVIGESPDPDAWREADLGAHAATLSIDGERRAAGHAGQSLLGSPFAMIAWLLDRPAFAGRGLKAGELLYCGSCTGMLPVVAGNRVEADFGTLGRLRVDLVAGG